MLDIANKVLEDVPGNPDALALLAMSLTYSGKYEDAMVAAKSCIEVDPAQADCWVVSGSVHDLKKDADSKAQSLEAWQKYLELAPSGEFAAAARRQVKKLGG